MTVKKKNLSAQMCGEIFSSSYKIRANGLFSFGQTEFLFAERNAFHQKRHISCKRAHRLLAFFVLFGFAWRTTVY